MDRGQIRTVVLVGLFVVVGTVTALRSVHAEHFDIRLHAQTDSGQVDASWDTSPPLGGVNPRPVLKVKVGEAVQVTWRIASSFAHGVMKGAGVHFFVVKEGQLGQKPVPNPASAAGIVDNAFTMDFAPNATASGSLRFRIDTPGSYLVRLQSEDTHQEHGHEHFSAVDLDVR